MHGRFCTVLVYNQVRAEMWTSQLCQHSKLAVCFLNEIVALYETKAIMLCVIVAELMC